jgi:DNA-binding response OmpR family regulator
MKSPIQELIEVFESREMSITDFYLHFLKERDSYLKKEKDYIDKLTNKNESTSGYKIHESEYSVEYDGDKTILPRKEFLLIKYLIENKNKLVKRSKILSDIWGDDIIVEPRTVDVHICKIKQKFNHIPIISRKGIGYIWSEN